GLYKSLSTEQLAVVSFVDCRSTTSGTSTAIGAYGLAEEDHLSATLGCDIPGVDNSTDSSSIQRVKRLPILTITGAVLACGPNQETGHGCAHTSKRWSAAAKRDSFATSWVGWQQLFNIPSSDPKSRSSFEAVKGLARASSRANWDRCSANISFT